VDDESGFSLSAQGGVISGPKPVSRVRGTKVTVSDIFFATPARLKFLKSERAEAKAISDVVKRLAMAVPRVAITLTDMTDKPRKLIDLPAEAGSEEMVLAGRLGRIMGKDFTQNAIWVDAEREGDVMSRDRHPVAALFIQCPPELVDVNVHPAKSEVRFRDAGVARGLIVSGLKHALAEAGHRSSTTVSDATLGAFQTERPEAPIYQMDRPRAYSGAPAPMPGFAEEAMLSGRIEALQ